MTSHLPSRKQASEMILLALPFPPTVNNLFVNAKKGRFRAPQYNAWLQLAGTRIKDSHRQALGPYVMHICLKKPDRRARDLGNYEKAVSDLLVAHGVVKDDSFCERLTLQWDAGIDAECTVLVMAAEPGMAA